MKDLKNLLFVCEGNSQRSPTFEIWFRGNRPEYNVGSIGTACDLPELFIKNMLKWADVVYCMDLEQEMFIDRKFPEFIGKVIVVGCDDRYPRESPQLFRLIEYWVKKNNL